MRLVRALVAWGIGSGSGASDGQRSYRTSYPALLAKQLTSYFAPARLTFACPPSKNDTTATDARWGVGFGWVTAFAGLGQMAAYQAPTGVTSPLTFTSDGYNVDSFDIYWVRNSGLGTFDISVDGGTATTVSTAGSGAGGEDDGHRHRRQLPRAHRHAPR